MNGPLPPEDLHARLAALREDGAWRFEPARWRTLEALARRLDAQPEGVRQRLQARLEQGLRQHAEGLARARDEAAAVARQLGADHPDLARAARGLQAAGDLPALRRLALRAQADASGTALAMLHAHLNSRGPVPRTEASRETLRQASAAAASPGPAPRPSERPSARPVAAPAAPAPQELASARRFRRAWAANRAQDQVERAVARRPAQAGPLNSHALVLESLALMRELSPDYLRHFMAQVESLLWLERARTAYPASAGRPAKSRPKAASRARPKA